MTLREFAEGPFTYELREPAVLLEAALVVPDQLAAVAAFENANHPVGATIQERLEQAGSKVAIRALAVLRRIITVAIMALTVLAEIAFFVLLGMI